MTGLILLCALLVVAIVAVAFWRVDPKRLPHVLTCSGGWAEAKLRGCERGPVATGFPVEPRNAYSNLAYLIAGLAIVEASGGRLSAAVLAASLVFLGLGSALYHGLKTPWAVQMDRSAMYAVFASLAIYALAPVHPAIGWVMLGGALAAGIGFAWVRPGDLNERMGLLLLVVSLRGFLLGSPLFAGLSLVVFALAFTAWTLDKHRPPKLGKWGHAAWHFGTAAAIGLMYRAVMP